MNGNITNFITFVYKYCAGSFVCVLDLWETTEHQDLHNLEISNPSPKCVMIGLLNISQSSFQTRRPTLMLKSKIETETRLIHYLLLPSRAQQG